MPPPQAGWAALHRCAPRCFHPQDEKQMLSLLHWVTPRTKCENLWGHAFKNYKIAYKYKMVLITAAAAPVNPSHTFIFVRIQLGTVVINQELYCPKLLLSPGLASLKSVLSLSTVTLKAEHFSSTTSSVTLTTIFTHTQVLQNI